jgi:acyl carrier protein
MDRQEIQNIIVKHLVANVDGVEAEDVDPTKSMADYDASSLDIVEIVSSTMRELKISIPRTEFAGIGNIDQLTDLFYRTRTASA